MITSYHNHLTLDHVTITASGSSETAPSLCERVIDLVDGDESTGTLMLIGTLFKDMALRPSVLDEYREEATLVGK